MNRKIAILVVAIVCVMVIGIIFLIIPSKSKSPEPLTDSEQFDRLSTLVDVADSVRNSVPDSAMADYLKVIASLQNSANEKTKKHLLARSYVGIANINSEAGDYKLALNNDSIAMFYSMEFDDKLMQAKAYVIRGMTFYKLGEYDKALKSYEKAEKLAIEINDFEIQAKISANRAMFYSRQGNNQKAIEGFTQALNIGKQLNNDPLIAGNYMNLAVVYYNMSKNDSVMVYYNRALIIFQKLNDKNGVIKCYNNIGNVYYDCSDYGKAIGYYQLTVKLALEMDDKLNTAKGYHNLAEVYIHLGDNATAADYLFKSIKIKEQLNDKLSLVKGYFGLGEMYYKRKDYPKSLTYFKKSLKLSQEINYSTQIGSSYSSIASVYSDENKLDSAIFYYNKAMALYKQIDYPYGISNLYINLGDVYRVKKDYTRSEKLLLQALKSKTALNEEEETAIVKNYLANLYLTKFDRQDRDSTNNLLKKAEKFGLESYKTAKRLGTLPIMRDASKTLKNIYQKQGKYSDALKYSETSNSLNDSLLNKTKVEALTFAEARWNLEKKQQEIDNLENTQKLDHEIIAQKETEAKQHKFIIWILGAVFLLAIALTSFIALYIRKRRDALYQKQLSNIAILRMQNIRNALSPHFVFNVLNNIWAIIDDRENAKTQFDHLINLIRRSLINTEKLAIPMNDEIDFVKSFIELQKMRMDNNLKVVWKIEDGIDLTQSIPGMILQIAVENAIKHGLEPKKDNRVLLIDIKTESGFLKFNISDNGLGLQEAPSPTKGTGTGLKVLTNTIHILNQINDEKMSYQIVNRDVKDGPGTKVIIKIPLQYNYNLN